MHLAALGGCGICRHLHRLDAAASEVRRAGLGGQLTAVSTHGHIHQSIAAVEARVLQALVDTAHHPAEHSRARVGAGIHNLIGLIAAPDRRAIIGAKSCEVAIPCVIRSTGLAADGHTGEVSAATGAPGHHILQNAAHQISGGLFHCHMGLGIVVNDHIAPGILHPGIGPGCCVNAVINKGTIRRSHLQGAHAVFEATQGHISYLGRVRLRQGSKSQLLSHKLVGVVGAVQKIRAHGTGVQRLHDGLADTGQAAINPASIPGPHAAVELDGVVINDRRGGDGAVIQGRGIGADGLHRRAAGPHLHSPVPGPVRRLNTRAAHHSHHIAGVRIHHRHGDLQRLAVGVRLLLVVRGLKLLLGDLLIGEILGGVYLVSAAVHHAHRPLIGADDIALAVGLAVLQLINFHELLGHIRNDLVGEIGIVGLGDLFAGLLGVLRRSLVALHQLAHTGVAVGKGHLLLAGSLIGLLLLNKPLLVHIFQHLKLPRAVVGQRPVADKGVIHGGVVGNGNEAGTLGQSQILGILAEIHP